MGSWQTSVVKSDTLLFLPKIRCPGAAFHRTGAFAPTSEMQKVLQILAEKPELVRLLAAM